MREPVDDMLLIPIIVVSLAAGALAIMLDTRLWRGYTLGVFALGTLILEIWGFWAFTQAAGAVASSADSLEVVAYALIYLVGELGLAVALTVCAVVMTLMSRQWWWLGVIVVVSVVPAVVIFTSPETLLPNPLEALGLPSSAVALVLTLPSALVIFSYAVSRSIRRPLAG